MVKISFCHQIHILKSANFFVIYFNCMQVRQWMYLRYYFTFANDLIWKAATLSTISQNYPKLQQAVALCCVAPCHPPLFISLSPSHTIDINWTLNQNMTIFPLFVKITEFRPTTPTTSDCVWSLHSGFMIAFSLICNWIMLSAASSCAICYYTGINSRFLL